MKRLNYNFLFGAIALTGAFAFTSCSSSEDETSAEANPTVEGKSVKTQFAITIGNVNSNQTKTRMTAEDTQASNNPTFLGMNTLRLIPFRDTDLGSNNSIPDKTSSIYRIISDLDDITASGLDNGKKIYNDVEIPDGTKNFVFYGLGPQGTDYTTRMASGAITPSFPNDYTTTSKTLADIDFSLSNIVESDKTASETKLAQILTSIANYAYKKTDNSTLKWSELSKSQKLGSLYYSFIGAVFSDDSSNTPSSYTAHAGSSVTVLATIQKLYTKLGDFVNDTYQLKENSGVTRGAFATALRKYIAEELAYNSNTVFAVSNDVLSWKETSFEYPKYLPAGSTMRKWNSSKGEFEYGVTEIGASANSIKVNNIVYPASIAYFCNSPAMATDNDIESNQWPSSATNWKDSKLSDSSTSTDYWSSTTYGWGNEGVKSTTHTVALRNNVEYGVANLKTTVKIGTSATTSGTTLLDNSSPQLPVTIPADGLKITGLLIGGQCNKVDWQFLPKDNYGSYTIYDRLATSIYAKTSSNSTEPATNYTLVFDNYNSSATNNSQQDAVYVAIEFENNTNSEFTGADGLIEKNQKFYLLGKLDPSSTAVSFPTDANKRYPSQTTRVFIQDFSTIANFTINSLKNAYVTIPDLRTTKMSLGLSVSLKWEAGLTFNIGIGGDTQTTGE